MEGAFSPTADGLDLWEKETIKGMSVAMWWEEAVGEGAKELQAFAIYGASLACTTCPVERINSSNGLLLSKRRLRMKAR